jgi:hypothetical protein
MQHSLPPIPQKARNGWGTAFQNFWAESIIVSEAGFAKMRHRWMESLTKRNCVWGGRGCPQGSEQKHGAAETPGSSMNRRVDASAARQSIFAGAAFRIMLFAALAAFLLPSVLLRAESASSFYKLGQSAEAREDYDTAFDNYQKAHAYFQR